MLASVIRIDDRVLEQLSRKEMRLLSLVVAIRKDFGTADRFKGDLTECVKSALRRLVTANLVVDAEGLYTLRTQPAEPVCAIVGRETDRRGGHA